MKHLFQLSLFCILSGLLLLFSEQTFAQPITGKPDPAFLDASELHGAWQGEKLPFGFQQRIYKVSSVLDSGKWYKLGVKESGIYRITYSDLQSMGFNPSSIDPRNIALYGNGGAMLPEANAASRYDDLIENAIQVVGESDGVFNNGDYIIFYGEGPHVWQFEPHTGRFSQTRNVYSDHAYYFVTVKNNPGLRISSYNPGTLAPTNTVTEFDGRACHEWDTLNLIKSGSQWYGEEFYYQTTYNFNFPFPNLASVPKAWLRINLAARSTVSSSFTISAGGLNKNLAVYPVSPSYQSEFANIAGDTLAFPAGGNQIDVQIKYNQPNSSAKGWLNFLLVNARRQLKFSGSQLDFRDIQSVGAGNVAEFIISNANSGIAVWDIGNPLAPVRMNGVFSAGQYSVVAPADTLREYIAWDGSSFLSPVLSGPVANQNLHALGQHEMIIITHPTLRAQAERLANLHYDIDQMSVVVVEPSQIYNEFSSGKQDPTAIRDFMKMFYDRAVIPDQAPKYLLLMGDASYDPKSRIADNTNLIPTWQSTQSLHPAYSYATDDYFGLLDDNEGAGAGGNLDIGIGRFPVLNEAQARDMVDKVVRYIDRGMYPDPFGNTLSGDWRNVVAFVGDDEDGNLHMYQADLLATYVDTTYREYVVDKIYFDAYQQVSASGGQRYPEVQDAINRRVSKGALLINYVGHGGEVGWALERCLEVSDIMSWDNEWNMPALVTATCEFSRYDDPERVSAGELAFLNPNGGAIGLFTTSRLAFSSSNFNLNQSLLSVALPKNGVQPYRMGDIIRIAKVGSGSISSNRNFLFIGDPALPLSYPKYHVKTTEVNGQSTSTQLDTIHALTEVTIKGEITDWQGNKLSWFNGEIFPSVFDKPTLLYTLGNDPTSSPMPFSLQKNLLYKGRAAVINGEFSFTFIVPKDISYQYGNGKISYYANNGETDAHGYFDDFIVGGTNPNSLPDNEGPQISLFINDTNFRNGGICDPDPVLIAQLFDESGINTVGNGIGHDLTAILDANASASLVLNDYYEAELNNYRRGIVRFPLKSLSPGEHEISFRAWDVHNNSSTESIRFVVIEDGEHLIQNLSNYPNPFIDYTEIWFEHNLPGDNYSAELRIMDIQGRTIKTFSDISLGNGYRTGPIRWYGLGENNGPVARGTYFYRLSIKGPDGLAASESGTMIILR
jgi:hypothetical protein